MLTAFFASLALIFISELGDKTFFIAVILATRHPRSIVLAGAAAALAAMTVLSVALGQVFSFLPPIYTHYAAIVLLVIFGLKALYDASQMTPASTQEVLEEAQEAVSAEEKKLKLANNGAIFLETFILTFLAEWGDRTQIATITLATANNPWGVILGAVLGHFICALIAVWGGSLIAGRISERTITFTGGALFMVFAAVSFVQGPG